MTGIETYRFQGMTKPRFRPCFETGWDVVFTIPDKEFLARSPWVRTCCIVIGAAAGSGRSSHLLLFPGHFQLPWECGSLRGECF
jgi:hypothetical protein